MLNFGLLRGKAGPTSYPTTGIPMVISSIIRADQPEGIRVKWDRPMMMTCDIKNQIKVIHGAVETAPTSVIFSPDKTEMGIVMALPFTVGEVVTWAYDDTGSCILQQVEVPNTEADNQTYVVENQVVSGVTLNPTAGTTKVSTDTTQITADKG